jgi:hypothetical protein
MLPTPQKIRRRNPSRNSACQVSAPPEKYFSDDDQRRVEKLFGDFIAQRALREIVAKSPRKSRIGNLKSQI